MLINPQEQRPLLYLLDWYRLMYRFRHTSLFFLYSRPCKTDLAELFLPADQTIRFSSMDDIFLKMSFCAEFCVMISIEIQRIGGLPNE